MLFSLRRFMFLFLLIVNYCVCSVFTQKIQDSKSSVDAVLVLGNESDDEFGNKLNSEPRNTSNVFKHGATNIDENKRNFSELKQSDKKKKSRTFLGPLNLDLKDKFILKRGIIYDTRDSFDRDFISGFSCCGSKYESTGYSENPYYGYSGSSGTSRYPQRPGGRPGDRYSTSSSSYLADFTGSGNRLGGSGYIGGFEGSYPSKYMQHKEQYVGNFNGNRYGDSRRGYGSGSFNGYSSHSAGFSGTDESYKRPGFISNEADGYRGQGNSYGGSSFGGGYGGFGSGGGNYGGIGPSSYGGSGSGSYGSAGPGSFEGPGRPGGNSGGPPGGVGPSGFGGGFGTGDDGRFGGFGSQNGFSGSGDGGMIPSHSPGTNIHTQKALALKALAGVALIGAAAALATNPVLLPLGVAHGRKKRSITNDLWSEHHLMLLQNRILQGSKKNLKLR